MNGTEDDGRECTARPEGPGSSAARPPMVSIILATYNAATKIQGTIESVLAQTYGNYEILVIDGGSADGTVDVIRRYGGRLAWWTSERDNGVYDAFNKGILRSRGEWLHFIGAGDRLADPNVLARMFQPPPRGKIVYGNVRWMGSGRVYDGSFTRHKLCRRNIGHQAILYRRELFDEVGLFDIRYPVVADWVFNIRCFGAKGVDPEYRDVIIVDFETGGLSDRVKDRAFRAERSRIIRRHLGTWALMVYQAYRLQRNLSAWWVRHFPARSAG